jgi:FtsZ-binding cell division protein ZapB
MTLEELKAHLAQLTREARETDKTFDELRADVEAAKLRTQELQQRSADVQRRLADSG